MNGRIRGLLLTAVFVVITCLVGLNWKEDNQETFKEVEKPKEVKKPQVEVKGQTSQFGGRGPGPGPCLRYYAT